VQQDRQDDPQFEAYLKRFHPVVAEPIPAIRVERPSRRTLLFGVWPAVAAAIVLVGAVVLLDRSVRDEIPIRSNHPEVAAYLITPEPSGPLTMQTANAWLAAYPSFKEAVDELAFHSPNNPIPQGRESAVSVLSKEKIRL
jgi:hypothetical protein